MPGAGAGLSSWHPYNGREAHPVGGPPCQAVERAPSVGARTRLAVQPGVVSPVQGHDSPGDLLRAGDGVPAVDVLGPQPARRRGRCRGRRRGRWSGPSRAESALAQAQPVLRVQRDDGPTPGGAVAGRARGPVGEVNHRGQLSVRARSGRPGRQRVDAREGRSDGGDAVRGAVGGGRCPVQQAWTRRPGAGPDRHSARPGSSPRRGIPAGRSRPRTVMRLGQHVG
jgi:hypothetical protein